MRRQLKPESIKKPHSLICLHNFLNQLQGTKDTMFVVILYAWEVTKFAKRCKYTIH